MTLWDLTHGNSTAEGSLLGKRASWRIVTSYSPDEALHAEPSWVGERNRNQEMHWWPAWVAGEAWFLSFTPTMQGGGGHFRTWIPLCPSLSEVRNLGHSPASA